MAKVFVSVGSNIRPEANIEEALRRLSERHGELSRSTTYRSEAVGFDGPPFLNLVVGFDSSSSPGELWRELRRVEEALGRRRQESKWSSRPIDLDLLLYDDLTLSEAEGPTLPHPDIERYPFVLIPLVELAGSLDHPTRGCTLEELLEELDLDGSALQRVDGPGAEL